LKLSDKKLNSETSLEWTGERLVTSCSRPLVYEHLHRYALACALAKGKRVLDIACGEGYGADLLARAASQVIGVDLDVGTIAHARTKYRRRNLRFLKGSCTEIPCEDGSVDLVASFETIEHISEHARFLSEIKRVLAPGGILAISSPDKTEYGKVSGSANPFHEVELKHTEFVRLIRRAFEHSVIGRQRLVLGSWIAPDEPSGRVSAATFRGGFQGIHLENGVYRGVYSIAVCSDKPMPILHLGMFENHRESADVWNLLDTYDTPTQLSARLGELTRLSEEQRRQHAKQIEQLQRDLEKAIKQMAQSQSAFEDKQKHITVLQRDLEEKSYQVVQFQRENERVSSELLDARWESLALREAALRQNDLAEVSPAKTLELENRAEAATSERDQLRIMVIALQTHLDQSETAVSERDQLRTQVFALQTYLDQERLASSARILELENRAETGASERDQLRNQVATLQTNLDQERLAGQAKVAQLAAKALRSQQKRMDRLRAGLLHKLILPFGRSQRKIERLTAISPTDD